MSQKSEKVEYFLVIDAGTSGVKVGLGTTNGKILHFIKTEWSYFSPEDMDLYGVEFNPDDFWSKIISTTKEVISESIIDANLISCIAVTSQRHGCVFLDDSGKELYSAPNRDARGLEVDMDEYIDSEELYDITGLNPPFLYVPTRYLWFKENNEEIFNKIDKILPINSWIVYRLTNKSAVDITTAHATQLIDLKTCSWSDKILQVISLSKNQLPELVEIGVPVSTLTSEVCSLLGLNKNTIVTLSGADTQSAIIGTGSNNAGDIVVVAGSTMPIIQVTHDPMLDSDKNIWSGCFFDKNKWLLEANVGSVGIINQWFVKTFLEPTTKEDPYKLLENLASQHKPGSDNIIMDLGIQIFNCNSMTDIEPSSITFPSIIYNLGSSIDLGSFCHALLENIAFSIRANIELIIEASNLSMKNVFIVGGLSKSILIRKILASVLNTDVKFIHSESTIMGGLFACSKATNYIHSIDEFIHLIQDEIKIYNPNKDEVPIYNQYYHKWLQNHKNQKEIFENAL